MGCCIGFALLIVGASTTPHGVHTGTTPSIDEAAIDKIVEDALRMWQVPGASVAVVRNDEVVYLKGFGVRDRERPEPVTPDTLFAIGSTTKAFTTTAMAVLADEGKLDWDDTVRKHVDWFRLSDPLADAGVTLRDLVCHRTGLDRSEFLWYGSPWGREEILRRVAHLKLKHPFRSVWDYNNLMYLAAGYAAGKAAGGTWEDLVRTRIFEPAGMSGANFSSRAAQEAPDHATPHKKKKGKVGPIAWRNIDNIGPAGSINAGAKDMARWLRLQLGAGTVEGKRVLSAANLAKTHEPQMVLHEEGFQILFPDTVQMSYAMGWLVQDYQGRRLLHHDGGIDGFSAHVALYPKDRLGLVVLANLDEVQPMELAVAQAIADLVLGLPKSNWTAKVFLLEGVGKIVAPLGDSDGVKKQHKGTKPSRELEAYAGDYHDPAYGTAVVSVEDGSLLVKWSSFRLTLEHFHFDTFKAKADDPMMDESIDVQFFLSAGGDVERMKVAGVTEFRRARAKKKAAKS
jgi:CubicO group peptidase (beta-lactamase class C family)